MDPQSKDKNNISVILSFKDSEYSQGPSLNIPLRPSRTSPNKNPPIEASGRQHSPVKRATFVHSSVYERSNFNKRHTSIDAMLSTPKQTTGFTHASNLAIQKSKFLNKDLSASNTTGAANNLVISNFNDKNPSSIGKSIHPKKIGKLHVNSIAELVENDEPKSGTAQYQRKRLYSEHQSGLDVIKQFATPQRNPSNSKNSMVRQQSISMQHPALQKLEPASLSRLDEDKMVNLIQNDSIRSSLLLKTPLKKIVQSKEPQSAAIRFQSKPAPKEALIPETPQDDDSDEMSCFVQIERSPQKILTTTKNPIQRFSEKINKRLSADEISPSNKK